MPDATLTISSRNSSSWSLRGWLLCRMADLDFEETARAELLLLSSSVLVPRLTHGKVTVWDTLAITEYLNEAKPRAHLWPADPVARAHARAVSGEMHSGFANLRSARPMNLKAHYPGFKVWAGAQSDIDRVIAIWRDCLATYGGRTSSERFPRPTPGTRQSTRAFSPMTCGSTRTARTTAPGSWNGL